MTTLVLVRTRAIASHRSSLSHSEIWRHTPKLACHAKGTAARSFSNTTTNKTDGSDVKVTDRFNLKDKNFVITGGGRGIGFAVTKAIAQLGGGVAVIDALPEPVAEFNSLGDRFGVKTSYARADVTNKNSLESAFADSVDAMGQLHGGLTAAGICLEEKLIDADWDRSQAVLNVNVLGTFWSAKLIARHLVDTKTPGSIVMIASLSAQGLHIPVQPLLIYNASKAAVRGMVGPLAVELGGYGIRVNSISPGAIKTPMTESLEKTNPAIPNFYRKATPVGRLGMPQDLTPMVCYLLSDAATFTTGADFILTGGIHAGTAAAWNFREN